jgi:cell division protein FtsW (lipid II flippase)
VSTTFTPAVERDRQQRLQRATAQPQGHLHLLALTSVVAAMVIGLSYAGRTRAADTGAWSAESAVNLNTVTDAGMLERALEPVFPSADDRRFAATQLLAYVLSLRKDGGRVANVGAIMGATVATETIARGPSPGYQDRLQRALERAESKHAARPAHIALFTADDLAAIKPRLIVRAPGAFRLQMLWWAGIYFAAIWLVALAWRIRGAAGDYSLLGIAHLLTAIGFAVVLSRSDPLRDVALFVRYTQGVLVGCVSFAAMSFLDFRKTALAAFTYMPLAGALCLSALLLLFGNGPAGSNARVNLGPIQPVEAIRLLLGLFLAGYFARRWELLRQIRGRTVRNIQLPAWIHLPRVDYLLPVAVGVAAAFVVLLPAAGSWPGVVRVRASFWTIYAVARNRIGMALAGLAVLVAGFYAGYALNISSTLTARVNMWQSAWDNVARGGDQIAQAIWALSTWRYVRHGHRTWRHALRAGGIHRPSACRHRRGTGLRRAPVRRGAFVVPRLARDSGLPVRATNDYAFFLATILTLFLVFPVLLMAAGMLGVVPLTGVVTPFVSFGGSAMAANFAALGILAAIETEAPRRRSPQRRSGAASGVSSQRWQWRRWR